jgi:hypothetical protein
MRKKEVEYKIYTYIYSFSTTLQTPQPYSHFLLLLHFHPEIGDCKVHWKNGRASAHDMAEPQVSKLYIRYGCKNAEDININSSYLSNWHHRAKSFLRIYKLLNCSRNSLPFTEHESSLQYSKDYQSFRKQYRNETRLNEFKTILLRVLTMVYKFRLLSFGLVPHPAF